MRGGGFGGGTRELWFAVMGAGWLCLGGRGVGDLFVLGWALTSLLEHALFDSLGERIYNLAKAVHRLPFRLGLGGHHSTTKW